MAERKQKETPMSRVIRNFSRIVSLAFLPMVSLSFGSLSRETIRSAASSTEETS